jgi:hypothetical protein
MITLYVVTHNKTGLKYFGKTTRYHTKEELQKYYHGSGTYWKRHLKKHGDDVTMFLYYQSESRIEIRDVALQYSYMWNIVKNKDYANLVSENGTDGIPPGTPPHNKGITGVITFSKEVNKSKGRSGKDNYMFGKTHSKDSKEKMKNDYWEGKTHSLETKEKMSLAALGKPKTKSPCKYCGKMVDPGNMKRWHNDNCNYK